MENLCKWIATVFNSFKNAKTEKFFKHDQRQNMLLL